MEASSATLRAPLVGTGDWTRRSRGITWLFHVFEREHDKNLLRYFEVAYLRTPRRSNTFCS